MTEVRINVEACDGCGKCVAECPNGVFELVNGKAKANAAECMTCYYCETLCPKLAIKVIE
ncbi:MAG: 4Fe-4S binding protein [Clostridia bacterium]|nr:4Fe-4S binding protein [Clostridia bacterium]